MLLLLLLLLLFSKQWDKFSKPSSKIIHFVTHNELANSNLAAAARSLARSDVGCRMPDAGCWVLVSNSPEFLCLRCARQVFALGQRIQTRAAPN